MKFSQIALVAAALAWPAAAAAVAVESSPNTPYLVSRDTVQNCGSGQIADDCKRWCGCAGKRGKKFFCQENDAVSEQTCKDIGCKCKK